MYERISLISDIPVSVGTLLVNERMLETYVIARDRFLSPNGKMFPTVGRIHMAPFADEFLFVEMANKVHIAHLIRKICLRLLVT
jgi:hypothetical protein